MDSSPPVVVSTKDPTSTTTQRTRESVRQAGKRRKTPHEASGGKSEATKTASKTPPRVGGRHAAATAPHGALSRFDSSLGLLTRKFTNLIQVSIPFSPSYIIF
mmetsp:Transcript_26955/g.39869  ORF Transcript_26955/g.39869 Transcript_26955/m.39869 type:complete len:103 (-) Transcript_26955:1-309(-)